MVANPGAEAGVAGLRMPPAKTLLSQFLSTKDQICRKFPSFPTPKDARRYEILGDKVRSMLLKHLFVEVTDGSPGFYSRIFTVPENSGDYRPVIDLSPLNRTLQRIRFKMDTANSFRLSIQPGNWATSLDLRVAFFPRVNASRDLKILSLS